MMQDAEVIRNRTHLLLENKKQNTFASENNLKSMRVEGCSNPQGERDLELQENSKTKV